jgi:hypothetical protein
MITIKEFMEIVDYRITEGSDYMWQCYGSNAYRLDSWNQSQEGHTVSIIFDTRTQEVYEVSAYDYRNNRAYRLINPDYKFAHDDEASGRGVDIDQAWDDVNYVDLETDDDFIQKALSIVAEEDYDTRVSVPVDFTDEELLTYMKMAHDRDMTFNAFVEMALRAAIDEYQNELPHYTNTDNPVDFPVTKKKKKGKK